MPVIQVPLGEREWGAGRLFIIRRTHERKGERVGKKRPGNWSISVWAAYWYPNRDA
jgi:hypothetical protein